MINKLCLLSTRLSSAQSYEHKSCPRRQICVDEVASASVTFRQRHVHQAGVHAIKSAESCIVSTQHDLVRSGKLDANAIISKRPFRVEVEHKNVTISLEADDFVAFVRPCHISRVAVQPLVFLFCLVHDTIEFIEVFVLEALIICEY